MIFNSFSIESMTGTLNIEIFNGKSWKIKNIHFQRVPFDGYLLYDSYNVIMHLEVIYNQKIGWEGFLTRS